MGYLTKLSAGTAGRPVQAARKPPAPAVPAAPAEAAAPAEVPQEPPKASTVSTAEKFADQEPAPAPRAESAQEPLQMGSAPAEPILLDGPAADDTAARQAHEAAESQRKAEWDADQAKKRAAEQAALDKLAAMSDADAISAAAKRVGADTEKITRRSMKEQVSEHIQALCRRDPALARRTMHPRKSIVNCFRYISRKAYEYIQDELKADGIKPGPGSEGYGCDVPDDLCFQWAEDYFNDPDAEEDKPREEKFVPRPYVPSAKAQSGAKKDSAKKKQAADKKPPEPKDTAGAGQITLGGFAAMGEKAG